MKKLYYTFFNDYEEPLKVIELFCHEEEGYYTEIGGHNILSTDKTGKIFSGSSIERPIYVGTKEQVEAFIIGFKQCKKEMKKFLKDSLSN